MSASAVNPEQVSVTPSGRKPTVTPRPMTKAEIRQTVADFGIAAKNALEAGFDGVQIQANYLYLIAQFLNSGTNLRLSRIEECDAAFDCRSDHRDHFLFFYDRTISAGHAHAAEADR